MSLLKLENVSLAFGHHQLLDKVNFVIDAKERVCLVGRNGTGKSSFLKLINNEIHADDGRVIYQNQVKLAKLDQDVPVEAATTVYDVVAQGLGDLATLISDYHSVLKQTETDTSEEVMDKLFKLQHELDVNAAWDIQQRVDNIITQLELPADKCIGDLSGGWRRRALLAKALVSGPDVLLLDEPTNHLDVEAINWLENFLLTSNITLLFITHDRTFLRKLATRIIELDRGILTSWPGDFDNYLVKKEEALKVEAEQNALFDKKLAQEEVWIRQGIKARRTRNEGRVRRLEALRKERSVRREVQGKVNMAVDGGDQSGKIVFEAENISFQYENKKLIENFSTRVMRGDRIGLIGPNGVGKSTLLQLLIGKLQADSGKVTQGTKLEVAYFDQQREQLDPEKSVIDNVVEGSEMVTVQGKTKHIVGYLKDFLFDPERLRSPVKMLSGGETNRLLLAKLFTKPANVLVLDEPTNDLDMETLELLEGLVVDYPGTILIVSHDRAFLDNVVTSTWAFDGKGHVNEYIGGYEDYLRQSAQEKTQQQAEKPKADSKAQKSTAPAKPKKKLSYKDQRELDALPGLIESLEKEQEQIQQIMADAGFYQQSVEEQQKTTSRLSEITKELEAAYQRWEELDEDM